MIEETTAAQIRQLIDEATKIVIIQADNPDADSLASSLALEHILGDIGKQVTLYCGVDLPGYLRYLPGSDRVVTELPSDFELSIIVDTSSDILLEQINKKGLKGWLAAKPCIVLDHHQTGASIDFAQVSLNLDLVSTTELIYELSKKLDWPLNLEAKEMITIGMLSDTLGLTSDAVTARTVYNVAELVENGVNLAKLDNERRSTMKRETELIHYKGRLLQRVEFYCDERIAMVTIPWEEIERYSPMYNPSMLVLDDMRLGLNTEIAIAFKLYKDGKVTAKIRCNFGSAIADKLAEHFGGGGHPYASGFKVTSGKSYEQIKAETIEVATELLKGARE